MKTIKELIRNITLSFNKYLTTTKNKTDYNKFNYKKACELVSKSYELIGKGTPKIIVAENPLEAQRIYNEARIKELEESGGVLSDDTKKSMMEEYHDDYSPTIGEGLREYSHYHNNLKDKLNTPVCKEWSYINDLIKLQNKSFVYSAIMSDKLCVISKYPKKVHLNTDGKVHNPHGCAIEWGYNREDSNFSERCYFLNGELVKKEDVITIN